MEELIEHYTREAGVRSLERTVASVIRGVAVKVAEGDLSPRTIKNEDDLREFLGAIKFTSEVAERTEETGVATGLAWTSVGGEILFIEATRMYGTGKMQLTGQLGDVMKESAHAALSYVRTNAEKYGIPKDFLEKSDVHIHIPAGGMPKDGPLRRDHDVHGHRLSADGHPHPTRRGYDRRDFHCAVGCSRSAA